MAARVGDLSLRVWPPHGVRPKTFELQARPDDDLRPIAAPDVIQWAPGLPKTRSGKIMRRLLKDVAEDRPVGDVSTLADQTVMQQIVDSLGQK